MLIESVKLYKQQQQSRDFSWKGMWATLLSYAVIINSAFSYVYRNINEQKIVLKKLVWFGVTYKFKYYTRIDYIFADEKMTVKNVWKLSWIEPDHYPIITIMNKRIKQSLLIIVLKF
jgi:hypothetical protein